MNITLPDRSALKNLSFADYYLGIIIRPHKTFEQLMNDPRRLKLGFYALLLNIFLYTLVCIFLAAAGGAPSVFSPWLDIPAERYYQYNRFFLAPSMLGCWLLAAGTAQLLSRLFSGKGRFEDLLAVFGFGIAIACLASLIHDLPDSFLGATGVIDQRAYEVLLNSPTIWRAILLTLYGLSVIWFVVLFTEGVAAGQRIRRSHAFLTALPAYLVYQAVFLLFNR